MLEHIETKNEEKTIETKDAPVGFEARFQEYHDTTKSAIETLRSELKSERNHVDEIEARVGMLSLSGAATSKENPVESKAFGVYLRGGDSRLGPDERKSLVVGDDTRGGFMAPAEFEAQVVKTIVQFSPVRQAARVGQTASGSVLLPRRTGAPTATWVGENEPRLETGMTYGMHEIPVNEAACWIDVSQKLLEDSAVDVASEIAFDLAQEYARLEGSAFVSGNGLKRPLGILSDTGIGFSVSGSAATVADADGQANGLISAFYALAPFYRNRATWMLNSTTLASIRKLKDGDKNYIWQPSLQVGQPETILGRPIIEAVDMPNEGAGAYPIVLGDFSFYRIFTKAGGMSVLRDPYTQASVGNVRFHSRLRIGGQVTLSEAFRFVKCST